MRGILRLAAGKPHQLHYFHQADDPYSALTAAVLPQILARYQVELLPHVVGAPPDAAAPAPVDSAIVAVGSMAWRLLGAGKAVALVPDMVGLLPLAHELVDFAIVAVERALSLSQSC